MRTRLLKYQLLLLAFTTFLLSIIPVTVSAQNAGSVILDIAWSPDGTMLARIGDDGIFNVTVPSQNITLFQFARPSTLVKATVAWSPLGDRLAAGIGNRMYIWDVESWQLLYEYEVGSPSGFFTWINVDSIPEGVQTITWSVDGRYVVSGTYSYETSVWDTQQGEMIFRKGDLSGGGPGRVWLSDGGWMGDGANKLNAFSGEYLLPSVEDNQRAFGGSAEGGKTEPRPDNTQIAWGTDTGFLLIIDLNTTWGIQGFDVTQISTAGFRRGIADISWDGTWNFIAVVSRDGELYVVNLTTSEVSTVLNVEGNLNAVDWNPHTNQVTYAGVSSAGDAILATVDVSGIAGVPVSTATPTATTTPSQIVSFTPTDDTRVYSPFPDNSYGTSSSLFARTNTSDTFNSYLKFEVNGLSAPIQRATLRLYATDGSQAGGGSVYQVSNNYNFQSVAFPWTENGLTWNNAPPISGNPISTAGNVAPNTWVEYDVTAAITGNGTYSFAIQTPSNDSLYFNAKEAASNQPELVIEVSGTSPTYTPTPVPPTPTPTPLPGRTLTVEPSHDARVYSQSPDTNFAIDNLGARNNGGYITRSYFKFAVSGIYGPIQRATLRLYATDGANTGGFLYAVPNEYSTDGTPWLESGLTWNNAPLVTGNPVATARSVANNSWVEYDVTNAISVNGTYSFALVSPSQDELTLNSRDFASNHPQLVIEIAGGVPTPTPIPSVTLGFTPTDDTRIYSGAPENSYGNLNSVSMWTNAGEVVTAYLKFDVSGVSAPVERARLRLYATDGSNMGGGSIYLVSNNYNYQTVTFPWTEGGLTWNNAPALMESPLSTIGGTTNNSWVEYDVTSAISGDGTYSFALTSPAVDGLTFSSKEAASNRPELIVEVSGTAPTYTPTAIPPTPAPTALPGASIGFVPLHDVRVYSGAPTANYGSDNLMARNNGGLRYATYFKFDVNGVSTSVQRVTLRLYATDGSNTGGFLYAVSNDYATGGAAWTESGLTWDNAPAIGSTSTLLSAVGPIATNAWVEYDVTAAITGNGTYSFALISPSQDLLILNSKEAVSNRPELRIELVAGG